MRANPYRDSLQLSRSSTSSGGRSSPSAVAPVDAEQKVDAASLSFAKRPVSLASVRLSGDRASMGDDGDEAAAAAAAAAAAEAVRVAREEEERHRVEAEAWAAYEAEEERHKAEEAAHEAEEERLRAEAAAWAAYEAAHSNDGDVNDGGANAEDGKGEDEDEDWDGGHTEDEGKGGGSRTYLTRKPKAPFANRPASRTLPALCGARPKRAGDYNG